MKIKNQHAFYLMTSLSSCAIYENPKSSMVEGDTPAVLGIDTDGDGILDIHDGTNDEDGDGDPNFQDEDSDGDTILDWIEAGDLDLNTLPMDSDNDGTPDFLDLDADNNCIDDQTEGGSVDGELVDTDGNGVGDFADPDNDGDGISDVHEIGPDCDNIDSDGDGLPNHIDMDSDNDGIGDLWEGGISIWEDDPRDTDGDGTPDYLDLDSDDDGILDAEEGGVSSPGQEPKDTDGDGHYDFADIDADGDGISDWDEINIHSTDPYDSDSDSDGFSDGGEILSGSDPNDPSSGIEGIYIEVAERHDNEVIFEFSPKIQMGDVAFLLDTTCSMTSTLNAVADEFSAIVSEVSDLIPDVEVGFATFDDYAMTPFGSPSAGDKPFILRQQITSDLDKVQNELSEVPLHSGFDSPESSMEALMQSAQGGGYDQNCDGIYDEMTDVRPFLADTTDPFNGTAGQGFSSSGDGGGELGGFGFRPHALPVVVFATDNYLRDPQAGYATPGGCPMDAGHTDVVGAFADLGGYIIGINTSPWHDSATPQMQRLAQDTQSIADTNGDGVEDDLLVFSWSGSSAEFRNTITHAIEDLVASITFSSIALEVEGDDWNFVTGIEPALYTDVSPNADLSALEFKLRFRGVVAATTEDQLYNLKLKIIGNETILLDTLDLIIVVPGSS
jgi:hypothetical protein